MRNRLRESARRYLLAAIVAATFVTLILSSPVSTTARPAQKNKKSGDAPTSAPPMSAISGSDSQQIDHDIGEMLGAFQVGNVEAMHKYYADNTTFVSGGFAPPVVGWQSYVNQYESQRAAFLGMQIIRRNTFIFVHQDVSWASYQWEFVSTYNGKPFNAHGQTTLVLTKVGDNWLIVHNHTSEICPDATPTPAQPQPQTPAQNSPQSAPVRP
jgi:ketosteroid isomerase-like protein